MLLTKDGAPANWYFGCSESLGKPLQLQPLDNLCTDKEVDLMTQLAAKQAP